MEGVDGEFAGQLPFGFPEGLEGGEVRVDLVEFVAEDPSRGGCWEDGRGGHGGEVGKGREECRIVKNVASGGEERSLYLYRMLFE